MKKLVLAGFISIVLAGCGAKNEQKPQPVQSAQPAQTGQSAQTEQLLTQETKPLTKSEINLIVSKVLKTAYKAKKGSCWITKHPESDDEYCMELISVNSVMSPENTETIYIMTVGQVTDFPGTHALGGLGGMFVVQPENGQYKILDMKPKVDIPGSFGGQSSGKFIKFGNNIGGWKFTGGGTFQGQSFITTIAYVFKNGRIQLKK